MLAGSSATAMNSASGWAGWAVTGMSSLTSKIYSKATSKTRPVPAAGMAQITLCCLHLRHVHCYTVWVCVHCCTVWGVFTAIRAVWVFVHCYTGSLGVRSPLYMQSGCVFTTIQAVWVFVHCYTGSLGVCSLLYNTCSLGVCSPLYRQSGCVFTAIQAVRVGGGGSTAIQAV